ncbi:MAG TPA: BlaI/MecI/CopY family transcriptional regulator [Longimicrobiales bacterium]
MAEYGLTELQLDIMGVLWERGEATAAAVREALAPERALAQTTVATLLGRLERKGLVAHRTEGRQYVYRAAVEAAGVRRSVVSEFTDLVAGLFAGDVAELVTQLLAESDVDADDLARVRAMIERREAELRGGTER